MSFFIPNINTIMKKNYFNTKHMGSKSLMVLFCLIGTYGFTQTGMYLDNGSIVYVSKTTQITTNGTVGCHNNGAFIIEAGAGLVSSSDFFDGSFGTKYMRVYGAGTTVVPTGYQNNRSPITVTTNNTNDKFSVGYFLNDPSTISSVLDPSLTASNYYLSDDEYWYVGKIGGLSSGVDVSGTTPKSDALYNGSIASEGVKFVWFDGTQWVEYTGGQQKGAFAYVAKHSTLASKPFESIDFSVYPNPVESGGSLKYNLPNGVTQLSISVYNVLGRLVDVYNDLESSSGVNELMLDNLESGLYILQFSINNGMQSITKKIVVQN